MSDDDTPPDGAATGLAHAFAQRVHALRVQDLTPEVRHWARVGALDTLGVMLAGSREAAVRHAAAALDLAEGPALWFGRRRRIGALDAALLNGTAAHALDFDDCNNTMGGHPSAPILSALLPLADELGSRGIDVMVAYVAGFEMACKLGLAVNFHHYTKGWHPTATLGVFGAAAACARLMGLDEPRTATALALAGSFASGVKANFGSMAKPLHVGHAARHGLLAARLARAGMTARAERIFEHEQGFLEVFNGAGTHDVGRALEAWGRPLDIVAPGIAIKQYPCCGSTHPAIDALIDLVRTHDLRAADVVRIEAWIHRRRLQHTDRPDPRSDLDAKFSLQYVLARALVDGGVVVSHFDGGAFADPRVQAVLPRVHVAAYGDDRFDPANHFGGAVRVQLGDGRVLEARVDQALGRTSAHPLPADRLQAKFLGCARTVLSPEAIAPLAERIGRLDELPDLRVLSGRILDATLDPLPTP